MDSFFYFFLLLIKKNWQLMSSNEQDIRSFLSQSPLPPLLPDDFFSITPLAPVVSNARTIALLRLARAADSAVDR